MANINDVVGELRAIYLELGRKVDALRLGMHLAEYRLDKIEQAIEPTYYVVSRETEDDDHGTQEPLPGL